MREVLPGVFHWTAMHPRIHVEVSSYRLEDGGVPIDPLLAPDGDHLLPAHGGPVIGDGRAQLQELVESGGDTAFEP